MKKKRTSFEVAKVVNHYGRFEKASYKKAFLNLSSSILTPFILEGN